MITRGGVYYNLNESTFYISVDNVTYVFSSEYNLEKFKKSFAQNRDTLNDSLSKRFKIDINVPLIADLMTYKESEKRGLLIRLKDGEEICSWESIKYDGGSLTLKK